MVDLLDDGMAIAYYRPIQAERRQGTLQAMGQAWSISE
jgi:hypothetical protein